jgi:fructokinase
VAPTLRFGIDLGGTKIELIALDASGQELLRRRVPTPQNDYLATVAAIAALVHQAEVELGQTGSIGIGTPRRPLARQRLDEELQLDLPQRPAAAGRP